MNGMRAGSLNLLLWWNCTSKSNRTFATEMRRSHYELIEPTHVFVRLSGNVTGLVASSDRVTNMRRPAHGAVPVSTTYKLVG